MAVQLLAMAGLPEASAGLGCSQGSQKWPLSDGRDELQPELFKSDEFRVNFMKVLPCSKRYCHDWTTCPLAHPGEKARRRDPRTHKYTGIACPDMKKEGSCLRGELCPYAHNVFEYWLHPTRYRTQLCNDGTNCRRNICFFAHSLEELRVPSCKPFVSPEALANANAAAAAEAARKANLAGSLADSGQAVDAEALMRLLAANGLAVAGGSAAAKHKDMEGLTARLAAFKLALEQQQAAQQAQHAQQARPQHQSPQDQAQMLELLSGMLASGPPASYAPPGTQGLPTPLPLAPARADSSPFPSPFPSPARHSHPGDQCKTLPMASPLRHSLGPQLPPSSPFPANMQAQYQPQELLHRSISDPLRGRMPGSRGSFDRNAIQGIYEQPSMGPAYSTYPASPMTPGRFSDDGARQWAPQPAFGAEYAGYMAGPGDKLNGRTSPAEAAAAAMRALHDTHAEERRYVRRASDESNRQSTDLPMPYPDRRANSDVFSRSSFDAMRQALGNPYEGSQNPNAAWQSMDSMRSGMGNPYGGDTPRQSMESVRMNSFGRMSFESAHSSTFGCGDAGPWGASMEPMGRQSMESVRNVPGMGAVPDQGFGIPDRSLSIPEGYARDGGDSGQSSLGSPCSPYNTTPYGSAHESFFAFSSPYHSVPEAPAAVTLPLSAADVVVAPPKRTSPARTRSQRMASAPADGSNPAAHAGNRNSAEAAAK